MSNTHNYISNLINQYFGDKKITVVDYGCGNGFFIDYLNINNIIRYTGYEVSKDCLVIANKKYKNKKINFKKIEKKMVPNLGKKNSIDLIILIGVIQYMTNSELNHFFKEVNKVLKKNGIIIFSCAVDHLIYKIFNIYQFLTPNQYINRKRIIKKMKHFDLIPKLQVEKGLFIAPIFSNIFSIFFDAFDRIFLGSRGKIGPFGLLVRRIINPLIWLEHQLPFDYGYTLYIVGKKK